MVTEREFTLQKYRGRRTRHTCPGCNKRNEFTLYVDQAGQPLAPHVGKCNRLDKCGYHYPPKAYFDDNSHLKEVESWRQSEAWKTRYQPPAPPPVEYLPKEALQATLKAYDKNNFVRYLVKLFGREKALALAQAYQLGTSKRWTKAGGLSVIFWQIDQAGQIRQAKVMAYDPKTGRRLKERGKSFVAFMGKMILKNREANLQQCLFGEHLLAQDQEKPVALVESEKTAIIMAGIMPQVLWLATGGKNGARWADKDVYSALAGRKVILYPDLGAFAEWQEKGKILATVCDVSTSDLLENKAVPIDQENGYDIADYFVHSNRTDYQRTPRCKAEEEPQNLTKPDIKTTLKPNCKTLPEGWSRNDQGELLDDQGLNVLDWWNDVDLKTVTDLERVTIEAEKARQKVKNQLI